MMSAAFSADGSSVLTASIDATAKIWSSKTLSGHSDRANSATFLADGSSVLTASSDATAKIWSSKTLSGRSGRANSADGSSVRHSAHAYLSELDSTGPSTYEVELGPFGRPGVAENRATCTVTFDELVQLFISANLWLLGRCSLSFCLYSSLY
jgi:WD40 repeat protein